MLPDDPDEDADHLDDEALLEAYLRPEPAGARRVEEVNLPDWPPARRRDVAVEIDTATLDWFKANHPDWRREIRFVLKAWVTAQKAKAPSPAISERARMLPSP